MRALKKVFSQIALRAASAFPREVDTAHVHFDTTSVSVWGDYPACEKDDEGELQVTYGHSKDKRPDLKQFLIKMLCIHRNIPVLGGLESGNESDKKINNAILTNLSKHLARHGLSEGAFVYISDSSMVTPANLEALGSNLFITRLPFTYKETDRVIMDAVRRGEWSEVTRLKVPSPASRKAAKYRVCEMELNLYGNSYRAVVVHSNAHDKRRQKKLDRMLSESREKTMEILKESCKVEYFCYEDAKAASSKLCGDKSLYHYCKCRVTEKLTYCRGRPLKNGERRISKVRYVLEGDVVEDKDEVKHIRERAGCFVLLTNTPANGKMAHTPEDVLAAYKEQHGIERNFGFLKDPLIVNDIFLKRPDRIEVLGFILLTSLLVWNLMEHMMREYLKRTDSTVSGWDRKPTQKPTSFMMTTNFKGVLVVEVEENWYFTAPLSLEQQQYVRALGLTEDSLLRKGKTGKTRDQNYPGKCHKGWGI